MSRGINTSEPGVFFGKNEKIVFVAKCAADRMTLLGNTKFISLGEIERVGIVSSVYLLDKARPWITGNPTLPRRAVVCADDYDGRRMAVLMEEEPETRR